MVGCVESICDILLVYKYYFICYLILIMFAVLRKIISAKRPIEYDKSLVPRTDTNPESYGYYDTSTFRHILI